MYKHFLLLSISILQVYTNTIGLQAHYPLDGTLIDLTNKNAPA